MPGSGPRVYEAALPVALEPMHWATHLDIATAIPTIQAVIARNEAIIEAVSTMLQCSCSQDAYLLSVMSLIIFKVLGCFPRSTQSPSLSKPSSGMPLAPTVTVQTSASESDHRWW